MRSTEWQSPREMLRECLQENLPEGISVEIRDSLSSPDLCVYFYDAGRNIALDRVIAYGVLHDWFESDGKGWDAYGIHGLAAALLTVGMMLDPQYKGREHRIPEIHSGRRLSQRGRGVCQQVAAEFQREAHQLEERGLKEPSDVIRSVRTSRLGRRESWVTLGDDEPSISR